MCEVFISQTHPVDVKWRPARIPLEHFPTTDPETFEKHGESLERGWREGPAAGEAVSTHTHSLHEVRLQPRALTVTEI